MRSDAIDVPHRRRGPPNATVDHDAGGSAVEFIKTIDNLLKMDFDTMIPGHGRVMHKDDVRAYLARFAEMNRRMRELARKKVPKDQAQAQLRLGDLAGATR